MARWLLAELSQRVLAGDSTVTKAAKTYGISRARLSRQVQADRNPGAARLTYTPREYELAIACSAVILASMSKKKKRAIPTHLALAELVRLGHMEEGELSARRANYLLRNLEISADHMRAPSPCVRLQAAGPNHVHEADFTEASFVYLDNLTVRFHRELTKKAMPRTHVLIGTVKDHYSRAILAAAAYASKAESAADTIRLLHDAWKPKLGTSGLPHGCPWTLYTDAGPGFTSRATKSLCKALFITLDPHMPGNARATGLAENTIKQLTTFQHLIKARMCQGVSIDLDRFNGMLQEWVIDQNNLSHPQFRGTTRAQVWHQIQHDDIRQCPPWDVFVKLSAYHDEHRTVTDYGTVKLAGLEWHVGTEYRGRKVWAYKGPNNRVYVEIPGKGVVGPLRSGIESVAFGTFKAPPRTASEIRLGEVREMKARLGYTPDDVDYQRKTDEVFIPDPGRPIVDDKGESERFYCSVLEAKSALADSVDLGSLPHEIVEEIERTLEDRADETGCISTEIVDQIAALVTESGS